MKKNNIIDDRIALISKDIINNYKKGFLLGEICRKYKTDITSILYVIRKSRIKQKELYDIYDKQIDRNIQHKLLLTKDIYYIEKYFPKSEANNFTIGYYMYWKQKYNKIEKKRNKCKHYIRHIRCSSCDKILGDASIKKLQTVHSST